MSVSGKFTTVPSRSLLIARSRWRFGYIAFCGVGKALTDPIRRLLQIQVLVTELVRAFVLTPPEEDSVRPCLGSTLTYRTADGVRQMPIHVEEAA
jgi:hypothetical protein